MTFDNFLPYAKQSIDDSDIQAVSLALKQELITRGPRTQQFEETFAERVGAKRAVSFTSATTALYAAASAADVTGFDRFLTTPNSFIATVASAIRLGARPYFVDIDLKSGNMSLEKLKEAISQPLSRGRYLIMPVHFSGIAVDMQKIDSLLKTPDAIVIEDAAHALGSSYPDGSLVGSCSNSHMTVFSFHAIKTLTSGEGGMVTTNDEVLYRRLIRFRNSGMEREALVQGTKEPWYYEVQEISGNFHMTEMQAALGLSQLKRLDRFIEKRKKIVSWYRERLLGVEHVALFDAEYDARTTHHLMVLQIDFEAIKKSRTELMQRLKEQGIGTQYHYIPLYRHPALAAYGNQAQSCPEMESYYKRALSFPLYYELEESDVTRVVNALKKVL